MLIKTVRGDVDVLAENIARTALMARRMPPAYRGAGIREPVKSFENGHLGWILDGEGFLLNTDLKSLGITRPIPHVIERSLAQRILDRVGDESGLISTYDGIIAARGAGNMSDVAISKTSITTVANAWFCTYAQAGSQAAGTYANIPTGATKNRTDNGALSLGISDPTSGTSFLLTFGQLAGQQINSTWVCDMLSAAGNILCTSNASQTTSTAALTRYTSGAGVSMIFDVTTATGSTAQTLTATYTNQAGVGSRSTGAQAMTASSVVRRINPSTAFPLMPLAAGDTGVQSCDSVQFSAANSAGVIAVALIKPLVFFPATGANLYAKMDASSNIAALVPLVQDAVPHIGCLFTLILPNTTSTGVMSLTLQTCWG